MYRLNFYRNKIMNHANLQIAVFGDWNTTNLGDKAILQGVNELFGRVGWKVDAYNIGSLNPVKENINLYSLSSKVDSKLYEEKNILIKNIYDTYNFSHIQIIKRNFKKYLRLIRQKILIRTLIPRLRRTRAIVVGGGALLSDLDLHFPDSLSAITWASKKLQIPLFCLGCSAEGEWSKAGKNIITDFAKSCKFIATRDILTANRLTEIIEKPVPVFGDFALQVINQQLSVKDIYSQQILAINVMQLSRKWKTYQSKYEEILMKIVNKWLQKNSINNNYHVILFTTGDPGDMKIAKKLLLRLTTYNISLNIPTDVEQLRNILRSSKAVIATRLHSAILGLAEEVPVLGFGVDKKIEKFFSYLGISSHCVSSVNEEVVAKIYNILEDEKFQKQPQLIDIYEMKKTQEKFIHMMLQNLAQ